MFHPDFLFYKTFKSVQNYVYNTFLNKIKIKIFKIHLFYG